MEKTHQTQMNSAFMLKQGPEAHDSSGNLKGGVGHFGETGSSALEFENTQPEQICHFLPEPLLQHTRTLT